MVDQLPLVPRCNRLLLPVRPLRLVFDPIACVLLAKRHLNLVVSRHILHFDYVAATVQLHFWGLAASDRFLRLVVAILLDLRDNHLIVRGQFRPRKWQVLEHLLRFLEGVDGLVVLQFLQLL